MSFDFTFFEEELFPLWEAQFRSGSTAGEFSFKKNGPTSLYGTTDSLISRYIINQLSLNESEMDEWAAIINQFQDPNTGWYRKTFTMHYKEHTIAYAVAALKLINRNPAYPLKWAKAVLSSENAMEKWINHPNWSFIWATSHIISGVPAALAMVKEGTDTFFDWYFNWLDRHVDQKSGFWRLGFIHRLRKSPHLHDMAGAFHMYYVYEFFQKKWGHPERVIDFTLKMQHENGLWDKDITYCVDLVGIYCLTRSSRNAGWYRKPDLENAVKKYLRTAERIFSDENVFFKAYPNTHRLTGALSAIAECQKFFPNLVKTKRPWKQSLDKACYI